MEATDDDCSNLNQHVCNYEIVTPDVPFSIDSNGSISMAQFVPDGKYEFDVIAIDCDRLTPKQSRPTRVIVKVIKSCKPTITGRSVKRKKHAIT